MSKALLYALIGIGGAIVGGVVDVVVGKAGASLVIFGIIIIIGGVAAYFATRNKKA